jgi:hypothetical protein
MMKLLLLHHDCNGVGTYTYKPSALCDVINVVAESMVSVGMIAMA